MTTHEHMIAETSQGEGHPEVALGYALMGVWGVALGLFLAWLF